ncbi:hypothetical protein [Planotetraspora sp. GP83]
MVATSTLARTTFVITAEGREVRVSVPDDGRAKLAAILADNGIQFRFA